MTEIKCNEELPPDGQIVFTAIDNEQGRRNEQLLKRQGNLWFVPDGSMYVYYAPTHWRPATREELLQERKSVIAHADYTLSIVNSIDSQIEELK